MPDAKTAPTGHNTRVISVYATKWRLKGPVVADEEHVSLGRLEEFYALYKDQLPRVILHRRHGARSLAFQPKDDAEREQYGESIPPTADGVELRHMISRLFVLPSDQVVAAFDFELRGRTVQGPDGRPELDPLPTIRLLERCSYARLFVDGKTLEDHIADLAAQKGLDEVLKARADEGAAADPEPFPPERHQIVFATQVPAPPWTPARSAVGPSTGRWPSAPGNGRTADDGGLSGFADADTGESSEDEPADAMIQRILYRVEPPFTPEFVEYERPSGLNHRGTLCAVTPYVSLLSDHPDYLENSVFLTVVQAIGTAARFRQIWRRAYGEVRTFRQYGQEETSGKQSREKLERLADELGNLELDLSFMVETSGDLGLLIPSLRIGSFHRELYKALELSERAKTVSQMFTRLEASIAAELTAIDIRERNEEKLVKERSEDRRLRWELSVGIVTFLLIPIGFLGMYFGLNASQVNADWSYFDMRHYGIEYLVAAALMLIPILTWFSLGYVVRLRRKRKDAQERNGKKPDSVAPAAPIAPNAPAALSTPASPAPALRQ